jgi:hypothetical protein
LVSYIEGRNKQEFLDITGPRRIFGPKRKEVREDWRKVRSERLNEFFSAPEIMVIRSRKQVKR